MNPSPNDPSTDPQSPQRLAQSSSVLPVVAEELVVGKKELPGERVVVRIVPETRTQNVEVPLNDEHIEVQRVAVDRFVDEPVPVRQEGDVTIVSVMEEVVVIERRLRVKEEIRLIRKREKRTDLQEVELRTEEVHVEKFPIK